MTTGAPTPRPLAPNGPQHSANGEGPSPFAVVAAAFGLGVLLAKVADWRGHAHPR